MEEDIKILEEQLEQYKRHLKNYEKENCLTSVYCELKEYAEALENLIKAYKEQKECLEKTSQALDNIVYDQIPIAISDLKLSSIPKFLIEEKIEELKDKANRIVGTYQYADSDEALENKKEKVIELRIKAEGLEELLGEEK